MILAGPFGVHRRADSCASAVRGTCHPDSPQKSRNAGRAADEAGLSNLAQGLRRLDLEMDRPRPDGKSLGALCQSRDDRIIGMR
jgi:hypothetical protein